MAERLKAHAWKACVPKGTVGSNPTLSAIQSAGAETSRLHPGTDREIPAIPRGFGGRAQAYPRCVHEHSGLRALQLRRPEFA
jgi:hypothetical protein